MGAEWGSPTSGTVPAADLELRLLPMGESALLIELTDARRVVPLYARLRAAAPAWVMELVPAAKTILVVFDARRVGRAAVGHWVVDQAARDAPAAPIADADPVTVELALRYNGPDLDEVASSTGLGVEEVIRAHTAAVWVSAFIGFAPGFAYLEPEDVLGGSGARDVPRLDVPRRAVPRTAVPAGSVALAAGYCGIYPRESPGGWQLIGSTEAVLWDPSRAHPALLAPGTRVRFVRDE
ncbi:5-oxoprolinase subunit B family protein [Herbiconiux solani]|uniref:5-oxoprolinase subunit B family protein n=1 Tax=Herbiconiux solani TaxID=661329 RepID=UPI000AE914F9|nr:allophanate hydrolase subunit 1 [Herbiconiux solani]